MTTRTVQALQGSATAPLPFKRLLVPLDGSALSERALPFARVLARLADGEITLIRAVQVTSPQGDPIEAQVKAAAEAQNYLENVAGWLRPRYRVSFSIPYGKPAEEIATVAASRSADVVVMATHGRAGPGRLLLGSVADKLLRQTNAPLLLVRADLPVRGWAKGLRRILVPLDGSELAESAALRIAGVARAAGARVKLLQAVGLATPRLSQYEIVRLPQDDQVLAEAGRAYLKRVEGTLREQGIETESEVSFGWPADCIVSGAAEFEADLIAMSTHGLSGIDRLVMGSVADQVVRKADMPVLLFRSAV